MGPIDYNSGRGRRHLPDFRVPWPLATAFGSVGLVVVSGYGTIGSPNRTAAAAWIVALTVSTGAVGVGTLVAFRLIDSDGGMLTACGILLFLLNGALLLLYAACLVSAPRA